MSIQPGEIYRERSGLSPSGTRHFWIIVSATHLNSGNRVIAIPCTSTNFERRRSLPHNIPFSPGEFCFTENSVAQAEGISLIYKEELAIDEGPAGKLDDATYRAVVNAIGRTICADCEPSAS